MSFSHPAAALAGRPLYYPRSERLAIAEALSSIERRLSALRESASAARSVRQRAEINGAARLLQDERRQLLQSLERTQGVRRG